MTGKPEVIHLDVKPAFRRNEAAQLPRRRLFGDLASNAKEFGGSRCPTPSESRQATVAIDGHIEVWADGLSFANAFSHPRVTDTREDESASDSFMLTTDCQV
jgi:hypothetical protein